MQINHASAGARRHELSEVLDQPAMRPHGPRTAVEDPCRVVVLPAADDLLELFEADLPGDFKQRSGGR